MMMFRSGLLMVLASGAVAGFSAAASSIADGPPQAAIRSADPDAAVIRQTLGLRDFTRQNVAIRVDELIPGRVFAAVDLGAGPTELVLDRHSVRAPGYELVVQSTDGLSRAAPPDVTTYRGFDARTGAPVAASIIDGVLSAAIRPDGLDATFIQPTSDAIPGAAPGDSVVYTSSDVLGGDWRCADAHECPDCGTPMTTRGSGSGAGTCIRTVEILFDTDYPFFQAHASAAATVTDIENIVNQCDLIYRRDIGVSWTIRQVNLRTDAATDPYADLGTTSIDPGTILGRVGTIWSVVPTPPRDLVHLMTGRDLASSTIGIAWLGVVCRNSNTGVSQSLFTPNLAMRTSLTAHEIGHNFNAPHDSSGNFIMGPSVSPADLLQFSPGSISAMTAYLNGGNGGCMTAAGPTAAPDSAQTIPGQFKLVDVLANDLSACGNAITLSLTSSATTAGGTVSISTGTGPGGRNQIRYAPPASVPSAGVSDSFSYRITEASTNATATGAVTVIVTGVVQPPACPGDFNASGVVSVQDVFDFLAAFFASDARADVNASGGITNQDLFVFLSRYFTPCP